MRSNFKVGTPFIVLGVLLLAGGMLLFSYFHVQAKNQKLEALNYEKQLEHVTPNEMIQSQVHRQALPGTVHNEPIAQRTDTDHDEPIGVIRIDKIDVLLQVFDHADDQALVDGAGVVETTDLPSSAKNTISFIAGHRGFSNGLPYFLNIDKLKKGDEIQVTTYDEVLYYQVVGEEVIEPTDWSKFIREADKTKLYLMTCHPYPQDTQRLLIKSELVKSIKKK